MLTLLRTFFKRSFLALFMTQYFGSFNDNFFRTGLATFITYKVTTIAPSTKSALVSCAIALFMLPFFLFSAQAGEVADKYRKDKLIQLTKGLELVIAILAGIGFYTSNVILLLFVLFLMGTQSAFFGPVKYSILPDILGKDQLLGGNGFIEAGTYASILKGTIFGGIIITFNEYLLPGIVLVLAILGLISSLFLEKQTPATPELHVDKNFLRSTWKNLHFIKQNQNIFLCILGISWFWMLGTAMVSQMPTLAHDVLNGTPQLFTFLLTLFSCGVGIGSLLCQVLVKGEITSKYVPVCAILITVFLVDLSFATAGFPTTTTPIGYKEFLSFFCGKRIAFDLLAFAICGGVYIVPLNSMLQVLATKGTRSRVIATNNIVNALFMVIGSVFCAGLLFVKCTIPTVFAVIAILNTIGALYICLLLPHHIIRMLLTHLLQIVYGVKIKGLEHWKNLKGNTLIIANHTSFLDAALLWIYFSDDLYFAIDTHVSKKWWVRCLLPLAKTFPIDPTNPMAVKSIIEEVKAGHRVVIFPEGRITTTGGLMKIYPGPAIIADKSDAQILPIHLEGSQYSIFSRFGNQLKTRPQTKITITVLPCVKLDVSPTLKGRARRLAATRSLYDIMVNMKYQAGEVDETIFDSLLDAEHLVGHKKEIIDDMNRKPLSFSAFLTAIFALGRKFAQQNKQGDFVGLMLPNSVAAVVAFFGLRVFNLTPCMLNFSTGIRNMLSCCKATQLKNVYTSSQFITKANLQELVEALQKQGIQIVYLEDIKKTITVWNKIFAWLMSFIPRLYYKQVRGNVQPTDPAVVLFTSGSEGTPKGVVLSHQNIQANRLQLQSVLDFGLRDKLFNAMPMFHSFGLTVGTLLPLLSGVPLFMYPSPLHYRIIPELIYDTNTTIMFGTDTFFNGYARMAHPYDFHQIRLAVVGAEKLKETTSKKFYDTFGIRVMEGYGATETAPVLAVNTPMYFKRNTVGRLLPGIEYKLEPVAGLPEGVGKLIVKGHNIMLGYLRESAPCVIEPTQNGWYDTGDIVSIDTDGFVHIEGRAKRFAKIAGEMVSLSAVETEVAKLWPNETHAIISMPEAKKGEQLVLFSTKKDLTKEDIATHFREKGISELAIPKQIQLLEQIPLMGTGKTDYVRLTEMATNLIQTNNQTEEEEDA